MEKDLLRGKKGCEEGSKESRKTVFGALIGRGEEDWEIKRLKISRRRGRKGRSWPFTLGGIFMSRKVETKVLMNDGARFKKVEWYLKTPLSNLGAGLCMICLEPRWIFISVEGEGL